MFFEQDFVYRVVPEDRSLWPRGGEVELALTSDLPADYLLPFWANGIHRHDLVVFGSLLDEVGRFEYELAGGPLGKGTGVISDA